jgi:hypothetical protein
LVNQEAFSFWSFFQVCPRAVGKKQVTDLKSDHDMFASHAVACFNIGMVHYYARKPTKAIRYLKNCLEPDPHHQEARDALQQLEKKN